MQQQDLNTPSDQAPDAFAGIRERRAALGALGAAVVLAACKSTPLPAPSPAPAPVAAPPVATPPPAAAQRYPQVGSLAEYRRRAARLIVQANQSQFYSGKPPEIWPGICTVTVMLNPDGSVRGLDLMRASKISPEVNQRALDLVRRTANFGPINNLPQPWQFNETFLFTANGQFTLDTLVSGR
jgi:outer membrane biosynthesis protein TonB